MFGLKKKAVKAEKAAPKKRLEVVCPVEGMLKDLSQVDDQVFSQKMLGEGFAVEPSNGNVVAPVSGEAVTVFPTGHAVGIRTNNGVDVLVHIGIDTVSLNGEGFETLIQQGEKVVAGQPVVRFNREDVISHGLKPTTMVIFTDGFKVPVKVSEKPVCAGDMLISL